VAAQGEYAYWRVVLWTSRILGSVIAGALALLAVSYAVSLRGAAPDTEDLWGFIVASAICVGYVVAWRMELLGAVISLCAVAAMYIRAQVLHQWLPGMSLAWIFGGPAFFFLLYWAFGRDGRARRGA